MQATPGPIGPAYRPYSDSAGYSEARLAPEIYEVRYIGAEGYRETQGKRLAVVRSAELTQANGPRYFKILSEESESRPVRRTSKEITRKAWKDSADADGAEVKGKHFEETTSDIVAMIPTVTLRIEMQKTENAGSPDAAAILQDARAGKILE